MRTAAGAGSVTTVAFFHYLGDNHFGGAHPWRSYHVFGSCQQKNCRIVPTSAACWV